VDPDPDWIRIQWGVWIRIRNPDPGARKRRKNPNLYIKISLIFIISTLILQLIPTQYTIPIFSSAAEPHYIDAAPAPCINFDAAPTLVRILPHSKVC
jgi:hypothetical protein